jgi:hypothetical protein
MTKLLPAEVSGDELGLKVPLKAGALGPGLFLTGIRISININLGKI